MIIMSYQASLNIAQSNAYFVSDSLQGDVVLYTNASNQNFLFGNSNSNAYMKISKSNVIMTNNVTVGGNMQVPSIQFTVGGNIPTSQVVNIGNISGYNTASYGSSNVSTFSIGTSNATDKFSFQAASNEVVAIYGDGTINQYGQDIANLFTFRNRIINGNMRIDQRTVGNSNSITAGNSNQYTVDRWNILYNYTTGTVVYTQSNLTSNDLPYSQVGLRKSLRIASGATFPGSGGTVTTIIPRQIIEGYTIDDFILGTANASPMSLSFWFKSSFAGTHWFSLRNSGVNTQSYIGTFTINNSNVWQNIQSQIAATPSNFTWNSDSNACLELAFDGYQASLSNAITNSWVSGNYIMPTGGSNMWSANGFIEFTGVQLEKGNVNTPFEMRPYGVENRLCQRYFYRWGGNTFYEILGYGTTDSANRGEALMIFPETLRSAPSLVSFSNATSMLVTVGVTTYSVTSGISDAGTQNVCRIILFASGPSVGQPTKLNANGLNAAIHVSAELT